MKHTLSKRTVNFIKSGYEGLDLFNDGFHTKDILIKTKMVMTGSYPSWGGQPDLNDKKEITRLIKQYK